MKPEDAATWCHARQLDITWTCTNNRHLVRISGIDLRSVIREYDPANEAETHKILDEMVAETNAQFKWKAGRDSLELLGSRIQQEKLD